MEEPGLPTVDKVAEAERMFAEAVQLPSSELERAIELLAAALQIRVERFGGLGDECARTYLEYGMRVYESALNSQDVFGETLQGAADQRDQAGCCATEAGVGTSAPETVPGSAGLTANESSDAALQGSGKEEQEAEADELQLAWESLESARVIFERTGLSKFSSELADVHLYLGDINSERDDFASAAEEYKSCIEALHAMPISAQRRLAEAHFKLCLALQFDDQPKAALQHCEYAIAQLQARIEDLKREGSENTQAASARELQELELVLDDVNAKLEELQQIITDESSMKNALLSLLKKSPASGEGHLGLVRSGDNSAVVQDLGVAGRGRTRIAAHPVASVPPERALVAISTSGKDGQQHAGKRSLGDILGGGPGDVLSESLTNRMLALPNASKASTKRICTDFAVKRPS